MSLVACEPQFHLRRCGIRMNENGFPKRLRVRTRGDFHRVYSRRAHAADEVLVLNGCENGLAYARLGLAVPRSYGGAVERNLWKRRMREAFRAMHRELPAGMDLVARPRRGAKSDIALDQLGRSLYRLAKRMAARLDLNPPPGRGGKPTTDTIADGDLPT